MNNSNYSIKFNESRKQWIAKYRQVLGGWGTKFLSKSFKRTDGIEAERELISWLADYQKTGGFPAAKQKLVAKSIAMLSQRWLEMRYNDQNTAPNTYSGFALSMKNWILDNPTFPHHRISHLDIESEMSVQELKNWLGSLQGAASSKLQHFHTLNTFFNDCIELNWVDENMANPFMRPALVKAVKAVKAEKSEDTVITYMTADQVEKLLTTAHKFIPDYRRIRYIVALTAGLRHKEIQGLTWEDVDLQQKTINIHKQLQKRGCKPLLQWKDIQKTMSKAAIAALPNAVSKKTKSTSSNRLMPLHSLTVEALKEWKRKGWKTYVGRSPEKNDPVFPRQNKSLREGEQAGDFCMSDAATLVREDLERLEMQTQFKAQDGSQHNLDFHSMRHTFSHLLEAGGADDNQIGILLGHASKTVLRSNYLAKNMTVFRELVERMPLPSCCMLQSGKVETNKVVYIKMVKGAAQTA